MKVLVINCGSSSLKYQLLNMDDESVIAKGLVERINLDGSKLTHKAKGEVFEIEKPIKNHAVAIQMVLNCLTDEKMGVIKDINEIDAFGHRCVHGGEYSDATIINDEVMKVLKDNVELAPLHAPANIIGIEACQQVAPKIPNVAVFDTAFHQTMPKKAYMYAIPQHFYTEYKIRKYGFHGTSHQFVSEEAAKMLGKPIEQTKIITCHIGNGASISAIDGGKCVDTTMGFTPLAGVMMGTRSGDLDPSIIEFIMKKTGWDIKEVTTFLNKQCGLLGISGFSSDSRDIESSLKTNENARLAMDMMCYTITKHIASFVGVLNGVDAIVFTAGIGENSPELRHEVLKNFTYLGLKIDEEKNRQTVRKPATEISTNDSKVKVYVIPTNEELVIARETKNIVKG